MSASKLPSFNVYRRRDGQLAVQFKDPGGKRREARIPRIHSTERAAKRWAEVYLEEFFKNGHAPEFPPEPPSDMGPTIRELADKWATLRDRDPRLSTAIKRQGDSNMKTHVLVHPELADVPIKSLGPSVLRAWVRKVRDSGKVTRDADGNVTKREPLAPFTTRNVVGSLTQLLDDCMAEEWVTLDANPMRHPAVRKEIPAAETMAERRGMKRGQKAHLTLDQASRLITCPDVPELRRVLYLVAMTSGGFRSGELYGATWGDVELDAAIPVIHVTKSLAEKGPRGRNTIGKTKTRDGVRSNPLHHLAVKALRAWRSAGWVQRVGRHPRPTDPIFPSSTPPETPSADAGYQRPRDADNVRDDLAAAGCPTTYGVEQMTFKDATRHSCATWLGAAGVADEIIGRLLGHSARSVTRRHYVGDDLAVLQEAVERIKLDLRTGEIVRLPLAAAGGAQRSGSAAETTAGRCEPAANDAASGGGKLADVVTFGGVAEWSKAAVLKTADGATYPKVRILSPPLKRGV
jgi:integrase